MGRGAADATPFGNRSGTSQAPHYTAHHHLLESPGFEPEDCRSKWLPALVQMCAGLFAFVGMLSLLTLFACGCTIATISHVDKALARIRRNPRNVRFDDLRKVCDHYFGQPRARGSHLFYKTPWQGEPLVNIQSVRGMAKPFQVRQVIKAIDNLEEQSP